jgi:cysteine desulfuration protein SufE
MKIRTLDELADGLLLLHDWEERYRFIIELGERLPQFDPQDMTEENLVRGCTSKVWLVTEVKDNRFYFNAHSDAHIVRGLIYLLISAYLDMTPKEVATYDIAPAFDELGLYQHLSPNRRNGFFAMVERLKKEAASYCQET